MVFFFFQQKTANESRISDWSSDVFSSDLASTGCTCPGAASSPHSAVNTTSDITRGLVSANRSRQSAGSIISPWVRLCAKASSGPQGLPGGSDAPCRQHRQGARPSQAIRGSSLNWWSGGGLDSVHSSVVAPSPHGLSAAFFPATNA